MSTHTTDSHATASPRLPELEPGLQLLDADRAANHALHALAVDHVLAAGGDARWIDSGTRARTAALVDVAPGDRILDRFRVARGFTPFQHLALLESLPETLTDRTALIVVPEVDRHYRDGDLLAGEGRDMLLTGLAILARVARRVDVPVLLTRREADGLGAPVGNAATRTIRCEATRMGPRFRTDDPGSGETLVYPVTGSGLVQTTLRFWERVLTARHPHAGTTPEVTVRGAD